VTQNFDTLNAIFSKNLTRLIPNGKKVSAVAREIGIDRTRFARYLAGAALPRPEALSRICDYFDVDARILTQSLEEIASADAAKQIANSTLEELGFSLSPVSHSMLPDGIYAEWKPCFTNPGMFRLHLISVRSSRGARLLRAKVPTIPMGRERFARPMVSYVGPAFDAPDGFMVFDQGQAGTTRAIAFTVYKKLDAPTKMFRGYKLSAMTWHTRRHTFNGGLVLEKLRPNLGSIKKIARLPIELSPAEVPEHIRKYFDGYASQTAPL